MNVLLKPIVTEKMNAQGEIMNRYGFIVDKRANKIQIRNAVEEMYDVTVKDVNTMRYAGKSSMRYTKGGMIHGKKASFKKAVVTLIDGDSIDFYSNI
jgi:large subunit ribosomal protein L23